MALFSLLELFADWLCIVVAAQVEDVRIEGTKKWKPGLALFGGKVQEEDADWLETTAREFAEETGSLVCVTAELVGWLSASPFACKE